MAAGFCDRDSRDEWQYGRVGEGCHGAVAPVPWRSEDAERALVGKTLNETTATEAGEAAVRSAQPLNRNGYKVQIAKTAVKRAVMRAAGLRTA